MTTLFLDNANVYTLDPSLPKARGLAIKDGLITRLLREGGSGAPQSGGIIEDLEGKTVLPGFTDAHIHLKQYALSLRKVDCETTTKAKCLEHVSQRAREISPGAWILGHGWDQNQWQEGFGTRSELDHAAPENPVFLTAKSLHAAWVNSAALKEAGINKHTPDPKGGHLSRNHEGKPTGLLFENAIPLVKDHIPQPDLQESIDAIQEAQRALWKLGLTGVHDFDRQISFSALQELDRRGHLKLRVVKNLPIEHLGSLVEIGLRSDFGNPMLRIGGLKAFADGALGPQTAAMIDPYNEKDKGRGMLLLEEKEIFRMGVQAVKHGLSMSVHAIGDRANRSVLDAYERLRGVERKKQLPQLRHRIEHVQLLSPQDLHRMGELNIIASMQPIHATSDMFTAERQWGDRCRYAYAWQTLLDHNTVLAFGSDAPVESPNPFLGLHAAVSRRKQSGEPGPEGWIPQERIDLIEAIKAYTVGPAYASGWEAHLGKLAPGYWGDLILLEDDPFQSPEESLPSIHPVATMVQGEWVWRS